MCAYVASHVASHVASFALNKHNSLHLNSIAAETPSVRYSLCLKYENKLRALRQNVGVTLFNRPATTNVRYTPFYFSLQTPYESFSQGRQDDI